MLDKDDQNNKWFVLVNPNAGNRKIQRDWPQINRLLQQSGLDYDFKHTRFPLHAIELAGNAIHAGYRKFIAVGGDGTFNEVVNAIFGQTEIPTNEFVIGLIPVGTGNDWGRMFGIPKNYDAAIRVILENKRLVQDIGRISYYDGQEAAFRYYVNIAGMGFDALVAKKTNKQKEQGRGNTLAYFYNMFTSLFEYKPMIIHTDIDGDKYNFNTFSMSVGICRYNGGGMMQLPSAIPDDGLLDVTIIKKIGLGTIFAQLRNLYTGQFVKHPKVATFRAREVYINSRNNNFLMEADGESLGHGPYRVSILPAALPVIVATTNFKT